nr:uncharacterized protein LOC123752275 isoform X3 [Procambarus clarkii]
MKLLVFVILAAAACASEIEKRDAEPSYVTSNYGSAYPAYIHHYHNGKRSAEPEPEPSYPIYSSGLRFGYGHHYYKRSAEPEPEPFDMVMATITTRGLPNQSLNHCILSTTLPVTVIAAISTRGLPNQSLNHCILSTTLPVTVIAAITTRGLQILNHPTQSSLIMVTGH